MKPGILLLLAVLPGVAAAQGAIQKCVDANGRVNYQDTPCDPKLKTAGTVKRDTTKPDSEALMRAEQDRTKAKLMELDREREWLSQQVRQAKAEAAQAAARERAESEDRADARTRAVVDAMNQPLPYVPTPSPTIIIRESVASPPPAPAPRPQTYSGPAASAPKK